MEHADWLNVLREMDAITANSNISLDHSQRDVINLVMRGRLIAYSLGSLDVHNMGDYPIINTPQGVQYHFILSSLLLLSESDEVKSFRNEWQQAEEFLETLALSDEQLAMLISGLELRAWPNRADRVESLKTAFAMGQIAVVIVRDSVVVPPKRGPEDLPVEEYTPKPYTLGPHEEPGYVPPQVTQSDTEKRKENYRQRKELAAKANNTPAQQTAAARLLDNNDNILRAESATYVYQVDEFNRGHIDTLPEAPIGLNLLDPKEIPGLENATFTDEETGFGAALFESDINDETMLTFRGTNNGVTGKQDWKTNAMQGVGMETKQYDQAMKLAERIKKNLGNNFSTVGHSLAGGLASAATAVTGVKGYTYNAAGLHSDTASRKGGMSNEATTKLIQTRAVEGEVLTGAQGHGNTVLSGLGTGGGAIAGGLVGAGLGYLLSKALPELPQAVGEMKTLPSVNGGNPVTRHGMEQVIDGIEAQKQDDIKTLSSSP